MHTTRLSLFAAAAFAAACSDVTGPSGSASLSPLSPSTASRSGSDDDSDRSSDNRAGGGVFTQTNDAAGNAIVAYTRRADGSLSYLGTYSTGGRGSAPTTGLGSQGSVLLTPNNRFLIATNAGSNDVSSFSVGKRGLTLVTRISSGGTRPVSVAATNRVVYALNNGSSSVAGFRIGHDGALTPMPRWTRSLSRSGANAAQVQFTRDGRFLVVVHRTAPGLDVFPVNHDGSLGAAVFSPSVGTAPFGFDITARGHVVVSEPGPNTTGREQSASSYELGPDGRLRAVSSGIRSLQAAPCWVVITRDGRFAYTANAGSGSISGYAVAANGVLTLITADGRTGITGPGSTPLDMDVSRDSRFLYVIEGGTGNVMGFSIGRDGSLAPMTDVAPPLPVRGRGGAGGVLIGGNLPRQSVIPLAMTRIVILGGGFGGIAAARELDRLVGRDASVEVTLVNRDNFFLFTPMLHEVAASDLDLTHIVNPIRKLFRRVTLFTGEVEGIDLGARRVTASHGEGHHHHELPYDHLVLALGAVTNFFGLQGLADHACTMKSLGDAVHLRNRLIRLLEEADFECASAAREPLLTVVVAGGGFAGVETMAAINDFVRHAARFYIRLRDARVRMVLVHPGPVLLPELDPALGRYAAEKLAMRGVEVRLGVRVNRASVDAVELSDGTVIRTHTIVWTAGTTGNPRIGELPCASRQGRVGVATTLAVPEWPGVWAVGDCALVPDVHSGGLCAPTAQHAIRQGIRAARNIVATLKGTPPQPYSYRAVGQLAAIGRRSGVAQLFGMKFSGFPAWWLWRSIYLSKLPRLEKKVRVALDWTLDLLFSKDFVQYSTGRAPSASTVRHDNDEVTMAAATL